MRTGTTIRISDEMTTISRAESAVMHRSLSSQIEYWARLGRAVERSEHFDYNKIKEALLGRLEIDALNEWGKPVFDEEHDPAMRTPAADEAQAHSQRLHAMKNAGIDTAELGD
ncbi:hypothetical protein [Salinisphaera sp. S4-8]|uniref:TA system antitoxin ParD family protein n=1 Tax=Salinisphaera sp. S4-8 TaxID=633357 RepID=UPI0033408D8C